jgi:hypothetical protein
MLGMSALVQSAEKYMYTYVLLVPSPKATLAIHVCFCAFLPQLQVYIRIFDLEIASYVLLQIIKDGFERYKGFKTMAALFSFDQNNQSSGPCPLSLPLILKFLCFGRPRSKALFVYELTAMPFPPREDKMT